VHRTAFQTTTGGNASLAAGGRRPVRRAGGKYYGDTRACQTLRFGRERAAGRVSPKKSSKTARPSILVILTRSSDRNIEAGTRLGEIDDELL